MVNFHTQNFKKINIFYENIYEIKILNLQFLFLR